MVHILGINAYHGDSSACLVTDGVLVAAAEEERFRRIKHWAGFPAQAIAYCLDAGGIALKDLTHVAINRDPRARLGRKIAYALLRRPSLGLVAARLRNARKWQGIETELASAFPDAAFSGTVHHIEHHLCHLASAFLVSPFERASIVSIDGFGDFSSAAWGLGQGQTLSVEGGVMFPHSLGIFYQAITQYLGFPHYGDEYKVMGLAPYGVPARHEDMRRIVRVARDGTFALDLRYFRHHIEKVSYEWSGGAPFGGRLFTPALEELLGPARPPDAPLEDRHRDIARSAQAMFEEAVFTLYRALHGRHGTDNIALAGGCGFNSVANGRLYGQTPYRHCYVQAAAGDAGGAVGAAFETWRRTGGVRRFVMDHAHWGPEYDDEAVRVALAGRAREVEASGCRPERVSDEGVLCARVARAIADGKIIGWFQGRMEWGPRALGNRSILADPRRSDMKDVLNRKIKRRESFRPFAPSVLREEAPSWFETDDDVPFMMQVFQIRPEKRERIPAVCHVDGSGRLQTVTRAANPRYHRLISSFAAETGIPMVLNTSFNENEPVVCTPEQALDCFLRTNMDVLALGDYLLARTET
ncbi:MAG: carbamoyltransferase [Alphaproteobacteria bacterium]